MILCNFLVVCTNSNQRCLKLQKQNVYQTLHMHIFCIKNYTYNLAQMVNVKMHKHIIQCDLNGEFEIFFSFISAFFYGHYSLISYIHSGICCLGQIEKVFSSYIFLLQNSNCSIMVQFFHMLLSLRKISLESNGRIIKFWDQILGSIFLFLPFFCQF